MPLQQPLTYACTQPCHLSTPQPCRSFDDSTHNYTHMIYIRRFLSKNSLRLRIPKRVEPASSQAVSSTQKTPGRALISTRYIRYQAAAFLNKLQFLRFESALQGKATFCIFASWALFWGSVWAAFGL